jgi:hypothetical protein
MTREQLGSAIVLLLCAIAVVYLFARTLSPGGSGPIWLLLAVPAIVIGRIAWKRLRRQQG